MTMKDSQTHTLDMSQRLRAYVVTHSADFSAGSRQAELANALSPAIAQTEDYAAKQVAANLDKQESVEQKRAAIKSLLAQLKAINQTARSINEQFPGIADQFKMPRDSEQSILNCARASIESARPIAVEFTTRGLPSIFLADIQAAIDAVEAANTHKANALAAQTAATAGLAATIKQLLLIVRELNAIMCNIYRNDPGSLAGWHSASHIQRAPRKKAPKKAPPSPTPPSTPPPG
jgi:hypothetical protein